MQKIECKVTVFFQQPFWVCVLERVCGDRLEACKITFGAEPKDYQVYGYLLDNWHRLEFSPPMKQGGGKATARNPKRMQRQITRQLSGQGVGTKSQQALKLQQQEGKEARQKRSRKQKEAEQERQYQLRQQKKKARKRGR